MWGVLAFYTTSALFYWSDIFQKKTSENHNGWSFIFYRSLFTFGVTLIIALGFGESLNGLDVIDYAHITGSCVVCMFGLYFYLRSIKVNRFANVGALSLVGNPMQWLIGWLVFHEHVVFWDIPIMMLLASGSVIQMLSKSSFDGAKWVLLSSLSWSVGYAWLSHVINEFPLALSVAWMEGVLVVASAFIILLDGGFKRHKIEINVSWSGRMIFLGVVVFLASYCNHFSYRENDLSLLSLLHLTTFPLYYFLSLRIFRDKPNRKEWVTFITGLLGLLGMAFKAFYYS